MDVSERLAIVGRGSWLRSISVSCAKALAFASASRRSSFCTNHSSSLNTRHIRLGPLVFKESCVVLCACAHMVCKKCHDVFVGSLCAAPLHSACGAAPAALLAAIQLAAQQQQSRSARHICIAAADHASSHFLSTRVHMWKVLISSFGQTTSCYC